MFKKEQLGIVKLNNSKITNIKHDKLRKMQISLTFRIVKETNSKFDWNLLFREKSLMTILRIKIL